MSAISMVLSVHMPPPTSHSTQHTSPTTPHITHHTYLPCISFEELRYLRSKVAYRSFHRSSWTLHQLRIRLHPSRSRQEHVPVTNQVSFPDHLRCRGRLVPAAQLPSPTCNPCSPKPPPVSWAAIVVPSQAPPLLVSGVCSLEE